MAKRREAGEKRSGRRPEGPPHPRKGGIVQTVKRTIAEFKEDNLSDAAAALTYYSVLSIFPALIALVSIVGIVGDPQTVTSALTDVVSSIGPASAVETFKGPIEEVTKNRGAAGILLVAGIASALWAASAYVGAFMRASNVIYEVEEGRSFIKLRPLQMLVTLVLVLLLALVLVALVLTGPVASQVGSAIGVGDTAVTAWNIAKWPVLLAVVLLMIALLYYSSPNAKLPGFKWVTPGSVLAVVVWLVASASFAFYVAKLRVLQQDLRRARRGGRVPRLALDHQRGDPAGGGAERRARAQPGARGRGARSRARASARPPLGAEAKEAGAHGVGSRPGRGRRADRPPARRSRTSDSRIRRRARRPPGERPPPTGSVTPTPGVRCSVPSSPAWRVPPRRRRCR
jgi:membrane protein